MKSSTKTKSIFYGIDFSHGMRRALTLAIALVYFVYLGFNIVTITTLFAVSSIMSMIFEFPTGAVADYDSRKKSLMISFFLFFVAFLGIFLSTKFLFIAFFWILQDIAWTFSTGADSAWVIDALGYAKNKSKIISLFSKADMFEKAGHIIGGLIGLIIIAINFRYIWLVVSLSSLTMLFIIWKYAEEKNFKPEKVHNNYLKKSLIKAKESFLYLIHKKNKEIRVLMTAGFISTIGLGIFFVGVPLLFTETLKLSPAYLSGLYSLIAVLTLGAPLIAEKIAHKKGFKIPLFTLFVLAGLFIFIFGTLQNLILAFIIYAIIQFALTMSDLIDGSACHHEFDSKIRASLGSIGSINWNIANSIGVFLAGIGIKLFGIPTTIIFSGILCLITAFIYLFGMRK